ncbi:type I-F CRISPR-associated helicase Cas3f [Moraxella atlantae]|uniref:CRISPR-associated helicase Cas3, subtype I-F/YPEST n=1 Tax=Faucicola atlantae TaxID=34059 RepID=A0A378Q4C6_9GAMM|nr:type I-F CRISPR-associated helicase Cas3f [Moraxella atlantae]OPH36358.1 type I-F CRISPR-associated helicase Cas3 [Moraxella atlantae]STY95640.1 CRISPR-associated helicase Cas3, subtype I-F/YPEST [Moraxella atlantae]
MLVTFICQCEKKALNRTRRILDAFANRIGDNVWQTAITEDGLDTVKKLLRQSATKSTAVSCHRVRSRQRTELVWVVGNRKKFDEQGMVAVNRTQKDVSQWQDNKGWQNLELVAIASAIAGLFHDFGKANALFQAKLRPQKPKDSKNYEPYRHEWVSLKLFKAFVFEKPLEAWLDLLSNPSQIDISQILDRTADIAFRNNLNNNTPIAFNGLDDFTKLVAWLIVSHHRLLVYPYFIKQQPNLTAISAWIDDCDIKWNSPNFIKSEWTDEQMAINWQFPDGLPFQSQTWQKKAKEIAQIAKKSLVSLKGFVWQDDILTQHLARLMLMKADHYYSSQEAHTYFQDKTYQAYANTDNDYQLKQKLDEHNIMVGHHAYHFSHSLPKFLDELPKLEYNRILERGLDNANSDLSQWQNRAVLLCQKINQTSNDNGFFGINMASTGKGKTFANARIMYALANTDIGCRFSVALGLRTLTTQTGQALQKNLHLESDDIATLIGSKAILKLLNTNNIEYADSKLLQDQQQLLEDLERTALALRGSESLVMDDDFNIEFDDDIEIPKESLLKKWFEKEPKYQKLLYAPILVSTIDYLMPATEGVRGGRQIAPMLRLLSGDLVLDEPDEFGLNDLPALARLVNWAGLLGSKVLLSSATIPPAMAEALFEAYTAGRQIYQRIMLGQKIPTPITCAWFDEFSAKSQDIVLAEKNAFTKAHKQFVDKRIEKLSQDETILRKAKVVAIVPLNTALDSLSYTIYQTLFEAHQSHYQTDGKHCISLGVVRFANINPLVAVAEQLIAKDNPDDYCIHYCVYHSQFTLAARSAIEERLDRLLNRKQAESIWQQPEVRCAIDKNPSAKHHIFVVLATSVCEVGRDHDYDWAIAEPSSMRSLIQLAGRLQRHRKQPITTENLFILDKNFKTLKGLKTVYEKPGFETEKYHLKDDKAVSNVLDLKQYQHISAIPSIQLIKPTLPPYTNLVNLEQSSYWYRLMGLGSEINNAKLWWNSPITWAGELQRQQPFRLSSPDMTLILAPNSQDKLVWKIRDDSNYREPKLLESNFIRPSADIILGKNSFEWFDNNALNRYQMIAERLNIELYKVPYIYGEVNVPYYHKSDTQFYYHPFLGVFSEIKENWSIR